MFHYEERGFIPILIILSILTLCCLSNFILQCIIYNKSKNSFGNIEEHFTDINITLIETFNFDDYLDPLYYPNKSNLGNTGKIKYDCFNGLCTQYFKKTCPKRECDDKGKCETIYVDCSIEVDILYRNCSYYCKSNPNSNTCDSCYRFDFVKYTGKCQEIKDDEYDVAKYCHADNLILNWKGKSYDRTQKGGNYTYMNNVVLSNETCSYKMKMCGIIDEFGNKLCLPEEDECPLNYIEVMPGIINTTNITEKYIFLDNKTILFSNKKVEGKIIEGLYADSDLMLQYNDGCQILDTDTISNFINGNKLLYRDSLENDYNPYKDVNVDNKGKSYLKWCIQNNGKGFDLFKLREIKNEYLYNVSINKEIIGQTKNYFKDDFLSSLFGFIYYFLVICFYIINVLSEIYDYPTLSICMSCFISDIDLLNGIYFSLLLIPYIFLNLISINLKNSLIKDNLLKASKYANPESNIMKTLLSLNDIYFIGMIVIFSILLFIILFGGIIYIIQLCKDDNDYIAPNDQHIQLPAITSTK